MRGESGKRERRWGRECKGRERGSAGDGAPWRPPDQRLLEGMTSGATVGITSGGACEGGELALSAGAAGHSPGVETQLLYVSSVTCTEKEVLEGEVREQESQEQLV